MFELEISAELVFPRFVAAEAGFGIHGSQFEPMMETKRLLL
jgi:hypothetical protein